MKLIAAVNTVVVLFMQHETALNSSTLAAKGDATEAISETNTALKNQLDPVAQLEPAEATDTPAPLVAKETLPSLVIAEEHTVAPPPRNNTPGPAIEATSYGGREAVGYAQLKPTEATDTSAPLIAKETPPSLITAEEHTGAAPPRNDTPASNASADTSDDRKLYDAGFLFLRDKESLDGARLFWRCSQKHRGCQARLHTLAETGAVVARLHDHEHISGDVHKAYPAGTKSSVHRTVLDAGCAANNGGSAMSIFGRVLRPRSRSMTKDESVTAQNSPSKTQVRIATPLGSSRKFVYSAPQRSSSTRNNVVHFKTRNNLVVPTVRPVLKSRTPVARLHISCAQETELPLKKLRTMAEKPSAMPPCFPSTSAQSAGRTGQHPKSPPTCLPGSLDVVKRYLKLNSALREAADEVFKSILDELEKAV